MILMMLFFFFFDDVCFIFRCVDGIFWVGIYGGGIVCFDEVEQIFICYVDKSFCGVLSSFVVYVFFEDD